MAHKKGPSTRHRGAEATGYRICGGTLGPLERRYPPSAAADALALMAWDHDHAGGHQQLAQHLGCHRHELLIHRWRLQILAPLEQHQEVASHG